MILAIGKLTGRAVGGNDLYLDVKETAGIARSGEVLRSGVPLPKALGVKSLTRLAVVDANEAPVPAEFEVLARWNAGKADVNAPIQWLLVTFAASAGANVTTRYRLVVDGSKLNPAPATKLAITRSGNFVQIGTGPATFIIDGASNTLFKEVRVGPTVVAKSRVMTGNVDNRDVAHATLRSVKIERQGQLSATVVVEGAYDLPAVGGGGLGSRVRYDFFAGSPTAIVRHSVAFEGDKCGTGNASCAAGVNGLLAMRLEDGLALNVGATRSAFVVGARNGAGATGNAALGKTAFVRQRLRAARTAPRAFELAVEGTTQLGELADGSMLAVNGGGKTLAVALDHMHAYEPQALRIKADGTLAVGIVDDPAWIGARQGIFATFAVTAYAGAATKPELDRLTWAPLNAPLRAWPQNALFAESRAVGELPNGTLPAHLAGYDVLTKRVLDDTLARRADRGVFGVSLFGAVPRYWGSANSSDEVDCGDDPTPGDSWDNLYWCGTFTDYHNGMNQAVLKAMRSGDVRYLDELAEPAALRVLHTQIFQCAPTDTNFYCGQAPAGYGGFRRDFNSSHAYFQNLMSYYWLTGDKTVVETLKRGATSMRGYLCSRRPGAACGPTDRPTDQWAQLTGRVASQWNNVFRFVGLASDDASFLEDYKGGLARAVTQHYLEGVANGQRYGFWTPSYVAGAGSYATDQLWMASIYDMEMLNQLMIDTDDAPIGSPAIPPSRVLAAWARTLNTYAPTVMGDGSASAVMPNALNVVTTGSRLDGVLGAVTANTSGGDPTLYATGKAGISGVLARNGQSLAPAMTLNALVAATNTLSPMGKEQALFLNQLGPAVARTMALPPPSGSPTPTPSPSSSPSPSSTPLASPSPSSSPPPGGGLGVVVYSTMNGVAALTSPAIGPPGTTNVGAGQVVPGQLDSAIHFSSASYNVSYAPTAAQTAALLQKGEISFFLNASYGSADADDSHHTFLIVGDLGNPPALLFEESDTLNLTYIDANWVSHSARSNWRAPVFPRNTWVQISARWDAQAADAMQVFVDGTRVDTGGVTPYTPAAAQTSRIVVGADNYGSYGALAKIDELRIEAR